MGNYNICMTKEDSVEKEKEDSDAEEKPDGNIYIVPTSHVSKNSSKRVHSVVEKINPNLIAVELDNNRLKRLTSDNNLSKNVSIKDILKQDNIGFKGKLMLLTFSKFQSTISNKLGIDVLGLDMLAGYEEATKRDIPLALVDQDMQITFNRFTEEVSFIELIKTIGSFGLAYVQLSRQSKEELTEQVDSENINIDEVMHHIENVFPTFKKVFLDERNEVIAEKTANIANNFDKTVLVIGAGHKKGVVDILDNEYENVTVKNTFENIASINEFNFD